MNSLNLLLKSIQMSKNYKSVVLKKYSFIFVHLMFLDSNIRILETVGANFVLRFLYFIYCNYEVIKERSYELT